CVPHVANACPGDVCAAVCCGAASADTYWSCFFFQAEDGIRDATVTGVQTSALPISRCVAPSSIICSAVLRTPTTAPKGRSSSLRSEERRVGKERRTRWAADQ